MELNRKVILVTIPHPTFHGGVGQIFKVLNLSQIGGRIEYFYNTEANKSANPVFFFTMLIRFVHQIKGIEIIHLNPSLNIKAIVRDGILLLIAKSFHKKVIIFFHGWDDNLEIIINKNIFYKCLFRKVFNKVNLFLLLGNVFSEKLHGLGIKNKEIIYLPTVADDSFISLSDEHSNLDSKTICLLFMAHFVSSQGVDIVLRTLVHLNQTNAGFKFKLIMAGDGPELNRCRKFAIHNGLNNVLFTGYVTGRLKQDCFNKADILFFPSLNEGLPCVIMEAMLSGLAIVSRPIGGIPYWVKHNVNGWLSDSTDPIVFTKGILSIVKQADLFKSIRKANRNIALNNFTPDKLRSRLYDIYDKILTERNN